ncbi:MAG: peptidylprolyl isomerase [Nitrospiraceae bacterium]|nr:peptidylprolyl isomerase [Nitrospiraceae bacterium]
MKQDISTRLLLLLLGFSLLFGLCSNSLAADKKGDILAQVGPYKLTVEKFEKQIQSLPPQFQMALIRNPHLKEQLLDRWVNITLLAQEARERKLEQDPEIKARMEEIKNALLAQKLMGMQMKGKVKLTSDEIENYYNKHKGEFSIPEAVKARHILIKVPTGATKATWEKAKIKAEGIRKRIEKGESFAKLAKEYSDDPGSKNKGGELGFFSKGRMVPGFESAAFSLKPGELSTPIKTSFGYHIIQVEKKRKASIRPFSDVRPQIKRMLYRKKQEKIQDVFINKLKAKYPVKVNKALLFKGMPQHGSMPFPINRK